MRAKIGATSLKAQKGAFILWDEEIKGFYARRQSDGGRVTFGFRYTDQTGVKREVKLGIAGGLTPDDARAAAKIEAGKVAKSEDPAAAREAARAAPTLADVWADYEAKALHMRKARVQVHYRGLWDNHLAPRLGALRINAIGTGTVETFHKAITDLAATCETIVYAPPARGGRTKRPRLAPRKGGKTCANHAVELLSMLLNRAGVSPNPCRRVERHPSSGKEIRFSDTELALIMRALAAAPLSDQVAFGLFLETANRHQTIAQAEWEEFADLTHEHPSWLVFGEKLKGGRPQSNYLSRYLADLILTYRAAMREASPRYLFPFGQGKRSGTNERAFDPARPRVTLESNWERLKAAAIALAGPMADVRGLRLGTIHTFKHTYLSRFADLGASAVEIKQAGDHSDIRTSMRYVKASGDRMRGLQDQMAQKLRGRAA